MEKLRRHLQHRGGEEGEFWPETDKTESGKYSRGLWKFQNKRWVQVILPDGTVTLDHAALNLEPSIIADGTRLFRVANRNQFRLDKDTEQLVHLSPLHHTVHYNRDRYITYAQSLAMETSEALRLQKRTGRTNSASITDHINLIDQILNEMPQRSQSILVDVPGHGLLTWRDACIARILHNGADWYRRVCTQHWQNIHNQVAQLIYIYNGFLGTFDRPMLEFGSAAEPLSPDILNLFCNVRFFSPESHIQSVLNYLLYPVAFRHHDIYKRGALPSDFVILEIPFQKNLLNQSVIEMTDYGALRTKLEDFLSHIETLSFRNDYTHKSDDYAGNERRERQLIEWLVVWGDVFQEVRLKADFLVPPRVYSVEVDWVKDCPHWRSGESCPICTRFKLGNVVFDVNKPSSFGSAMAMFGTRMNQADPVEKAVFASILPRTWQIGLANRKPITPVSP